jgi:hypothetical protein
MLTRAHWRAIRGAQAELIKARPLDHQRKCRCRACELAKLTKLQRDEDISYQGPERIGPRGEKRRTGHYDDDQNPVGQPVGRTLSAWHPPDEDDPAMAPRGTWRQMRQTRIGWYFEIDHAAPPGANLRRYWGLTGGPAEDEMLWMMLLLAPLSTAEFAAVAALWTSSTEAEAAEDLGISQQALNKNRRRGVAKFAAAFSGTRAPVLSKGRSEAYGKVPPASQGFLREVPALERTCPVCGGFLSRYNPGDQCWSHRISAGQAGLLDVPKKVNGAANTSDDVEAAL